MKQAAGPLQRIVKTANMGRASDGGDVALLRRVLWPNTNLAVSQHQWPEERGSPTQRAAWHGAEENLNTQSTSSTTMDLGLSQLLRVEKPEADNRAAVWPYHSF